VNEMEEIAKLLPGYNCGECGSKSCADFADKLAFEADLDLCPFLAQERFDKNLARIVRLLAQDRGSDEDLTGVVDGLHADFALGPLPGEKSCREDLYPFDRDARIAAGDIIRYRPLGCPVTHFAEVLKFSRGIATVHIVGPRHLLGDKDFKFNDVGICMVAAFEGTVVRGKVPRVCQTVRFLPEHCMMQKVHSGVVVHSEGRMLRIEGIDLKVW
jgi:uncharacterized protein